MTGILLQPYPLDDKPKTRFITAICISLFITLFLYLFRPFGIGALGRAGSFAIYIGYGLVTLTGLLLNFFIVPKLLPSLFREERWTVLHELIHTLVIIFTIGIGNTLYTYLIFNRKFSFEGFLWFQGVTLLVSVFPVAFIVIIKQNRLMRKNREEAGRLSGRLRRYKKMESVDRMKVSLTGENFDDLIVLPAADILYLQSADNYIEVCFVDNGDIKKKLLRNTLKAARGQLKNFTSFYRCHRSWIVNLDRVVAVNGNAQGYRLVLDKTDIQVPVSRSLNSELDNRLAK